MFIQTEQTPNPLTLKFIPGLILLVGQSVDFDGKEAARNSPLALKLFDIDGVTRVFIGEEFVSITKTEESSWETLKPHILSTLMDHLLAQKPILLEEMEENFEENITYTEEEQKIVDQIKELIETRVRPAVAMDGGDIVFAKFQNGTVYLKLRGACSGCPSSSATLKSGIENMLRYYVPEVLEVEQIV
jgi:Fe-S cluster biogenesis protein NfuA